MRAMHALFVQRRNRKMECIPKALIRAGFRRLVILRSVSENGFRRAASLSSSSFQVGRWKQINCAQVGMPPFLVRKPYHHFRFLMQVNNWQIQCHKLALLRITNNDYGIFENNRATCAAYVPNQCISRQPAITPQTCRRKRCIRHTVG